MRILISNDDGYSAPGIRALAKAMRRFGYVTVVAPEFNQSGTSNALTLTRPLQVQEVENEELRDSIDATQQDGSEYVERVAREELDYAKASLILFDDFRSGKMGRITLEWAPL